MISSALKASANAGAFGFRRIGLTLLLVVLLDVGWEVFAVRVKQYWFWQPTKLAFDWYGTPVTNFLGWTVATLLILAFATPCLINKKPVAQPPPDYSPLAVWLLLSLLFATGAAVQQLWLAVGVISGISLVLTVFAVRGARW